MLAYIIASTPLTAIAILFAADDMPATPTTIIGAFIVIALSMSALVGLVVKRLLEDAKDDRKTFAAALVAMDTKQDERARSEDARIETLIKAGDLRHEKLDLRFERLLSLFQQEQRDQRVHDSNQTAELRSVMLQAFQAMRTAVHDVKDTANKAVVASAVADEMSRREKQI